MSRFTKRGTLENANDQELEELLKRASEHEQEKRQESAEKPVRERLRTKANRLTNPSPNTSIGAALL